MASLDVNKFVIRKKKTKKKIFFTFEVAGSNKLEKKK